MCREKTANRISGERTMKQYQAYFFDLYGTLVDIHTEEGKAALWKKTASYYTEHGAAYDAKALRSGYLALCEGETKRLEKQFPGALVEIDLLRVFRRLYTARGVTPDEALLADTAWAFRRASTTHLRAYAGAGELLDGLRSAGKRAILLSNAQSCFTRPELAQLELAEGFDRIFISSEAGFRKPDPRFFRHALESLGLAPGDCLMIGNDLACDLGGAASVGMDGLYIRSGLSPKADAGAPLPANAAAAFPRMDLRALKQALLAK